jgi:hypothetical protein
MGVRSISAFARNAMQRLLQHASSGESQSQDLESRVQVLDTKVARLQGEVSQLSRLVAKTEDK